MIKLIQIQIFNEMKSSCEIQNKCFVLLEVLQKMYV